MDIEVVTYGPTVIGASTAKQGAELIRADEAERRTNEAVHPEHPHRSNIWRNHYDAMTITNTELQDHE